MCHAEARNSHLFKKENRCENNQFNRFVLRQKQIRQTPAIKHEIEIHVKSKKPEPAPLYVMKNYTKSQDVI